MIKNSIKYGLILGAVSLICTLMVSSMHVVVSPIIVKRTAQKVRDNLNKIYAGSTFEYNDVTTDLKADKSDIIDALYEIALPSGDKNYVYKMSPEGRNDEIHFLIAYDTKGTVLKIQYVQMRETKGRGDKITKDNYLKPIYAQNASNMKVDMITGATYSSKAMKLSIEATSKHLITEVLK